MASGIDFEAWGFQLYILAMSKPDVTEIAYLEPAIYAARLRDQKHLMLLESVMRHEHLGRWSFLMCNPSDVIRVDRSGDSSALEKLRLKLAENKSETLAGLPPFQGGYAGFVSYDFGWQLLGAKRPPDFKPLCPDLIFNRYDTVISFDHMQERAFIVGPDAAALEKLLKRKPVASGDFVISGWQSNFTREAYEKAVAEIVEYILAGDIFQANMTQCFSSLIPHGFDAFAFYQNLRKQNPAPFASYLNFGDVQIVSSSPERLISSDGAHVQARPIKGTRRRDVDTALDAALIAELQASAKDRAENVMIVDLLRNDLSRIGKLGSVKVPVLCGLESYANVHHLVSVVEAELRDGLTSIDVLNAVFPGGSITGAPKIRAMEIIAELENQARGIYCGSIGYLGFNGACDFNIAIRTALFSGGKGYVQGGGGITARSNPAEEYEESLTKISRLMKASTP
jgi:para-aminobenzoate synthetase component I